MNLDDIDWTTNALGIISLGKVFGVFSCNDPTSIVAVPKFTDIVCLSPKMAEILFKYNLAISGQDSRIVDAKKLREAAKNSDLLSFFFGQEGFFIDEREYSKEEIERFRPLATILKNFYFYFDEDYKNKMKRIYNNLLEFKIGDEYILFDAREARSTLVLKKDGNAFSANLSVGDGTIALIGPNLYYCLCGLSDHIVSLANGARHKDGEVSNRYRYRVEADDDGRYLFGNVLKVGLSDELKDFREEKFGADDGKGF